MKKTICQSVACAWEAAQRPEMRHRLHYEWGLYKSKNEKSPLASFRFHHECASPLIKILAIIGLIMAMCAFITSIKAAIDRRCHRSILHCKKEHI